ncbi:hypothetical protein [Mucisphaera sp.]|uniref:hypothetical protein n=1 Tax=Mucisphaera sp. TaxID=2913024 RepID=UPI003D0A5099
MNDELMMQIQENYGVEVKVQSEYTTLRDLDREEPDSLCAEVKLDVMMRVPEGFSTEAEALEWITEAEKRLHLAITELTVDAVEHIRNKTIQAMKDVLQD